MSETPGSSTAEKLAAVNWAIYGGLVSIAEISTKNFPDLIDGRYQLQELLGNGGMGSVYRAIQRPVDRLVALKLLRPSHTRDHEREVKRFFKEARAIASLHHPNIIPLFDFGQCDSGDIFMVMELLPGVSLGALMAEEGPMALSRVVYILDQVLDALQEAHRHKIVHRDLKPDNIQIGRRGDREDFVTVLDFGIAREASLGGKPTSTTIEVCGTPAYMAPEQILGNSVDPRADLYSVGVLLFEMVTGRLPFPMDRTIDLYMAHLKDEPPRLAQLMSEAVPTGLQELLDRILTKAACDRIPDAASFRRALRSVVGLPSGRGVSATNPGLSPLCLDGGIELVAAVEPARSPGVKELIQDWALDIAQAGGIVRETRKGCIVAVFPSNADIEMVMRTALSLKKRTRAQRLSLLRPIYLRVGIHTVPGLAERLCDDAPRGGILLGADCINDAEGTNTRRRFRLEAAGQLRFRGHRGPVKLLHVISGR